MSYAFTDTVNARHILLEKHQECGGLVERAFFTEKPTSRRGWVIRGLSIYSQDEAQAHVTRENTMMSPRSAVRTCTLTGKMKAKRILHEKT